MAGRMGRVLLSAYVDGVKENQITWESSILALSFRLATELRHTDTTRICTDSKTAFPWFRSVEIRVVSVWRSSVADSESKNQEQISIISSPLFHGRSVIFARMVEG
jgi:hypothetical protein